MFVYPVAAHQGPCRCVCIDYISRCKCYQSCTHSNTLTHTLIVSAACHFDSRAWMHLSYIWCFPRSLHIHHELSCLRSGFCIWLVTFLTSSLILRIRTECCRHMVYTVWAMCVKPTDCVCVCAWVYLCVWRVAAAVFVIDRPHF